MRTIQLGMAYTDKTPVVTASSEVLEGLEGARDQLRLLEQGMVVLAVEWVKHHPGDASAQMDVAAMSRSASSASGGRSAGGDAHARRALSRFDDGQRGWDVLAAMGCLHFDDFQLPEFAIAAGLTEYSARKLLRESLMLVHLLPRVWSRVLEGGLDVWRARALAGDCWDLPPEAIEFIDAQMSDVTARVTKTSRDRIITEARRRFEAAEESAAEERALEERCVEVDVHRQQHGVVPLFGGLDLPDALAIDAALVAGAQALKDLGSDAPLNVRRSWALGDLARSASDHGALFSFDATGGPHACTCTCADHSHSAAPEIAISSPADADDAEGVRGAAPPGDSWVAAGALGSLPEGAKRPFWNGMGASPPKVKLFIHVPSPGGESCPTCFTGTTVPSGTGGGAPVGGSARVEGKGIAGAVICGQEAVRGWFTRPTMAGGFMPPLTIRSVLNRDEDAGTDSYTPTDRISDQVRLRSENCIFPFCNRPAWCCDVDHAEPWKPNGDGGATCTCNLAPLCRSHHRLKTHSDNLPTDEEARPAGEHARWTYVHLGEDEYFWKAPRGLRFIKTRQGTFEASDGGRAGAPVHPGAPLSQDERLRLAENTIDRLLRNAAHTRPIHHTDYSPAFDSQEAGERRPEPDRDTAELQLPPDAKIPITSKAAMKQFSGAVDPRFSPVEPVNLAESTLEGVLIDDLAWLLRGTGEATGAQADLQKFAVGLPEQYHGGEAA